jgi:hypothetical protein
MVTDRGVAVGNSFVKVGIVATGSSGEAGAAAGGLLMEVGAIIGGGDWAAASGIADGRLDVSPCWLHPHRDKPTSVLAAAIWIFRSDLILVLPSFTPVFVGDSHRWFLLGSRAAGP